MYAERLAALLECAAARLSGLLEISGVEAGLQTVGWLRGGIDGEEAAAAAARHGVEVTPLSRYARGPLARDGLQLGFAAVDTREIRRGVEDLALALAGEVATRARGGRRRAAGERRRRPAGQRRSRPAGERRAARDTAPVE